MSEPFLPLAVFFFRQHTPSAGPEPALRISGRIGKRGVQLKRIVFYDEDMNPLTAASHDVIACFGIIENVIRASLLGIIPG